MALICHILKVVVGGFWKRSIHSAEGLFAEKGGIMKALGWMMPVFAIAIIVDAGLAFSGSLPMRIREDVQLVSDGLQAALKARGLEYSDAAWPKQLSQKKVSAQEIPGRVLAKAANRLRVMIRKEYLPKEPNDWLVGIRKPVCGYTADYLVMRYALGPHLIQVQENGVAVSLLIDVNDPNLLSTRVEDFLTRAVRTFLNYPVDKLSKLKFHLRSFAHGGQTISYGTMDCDFDVASKQAWQKRKWWNHTYVWTDGRRVYFSLVQMDGATYENKGQAKPGFPKRFVRSRQPT